MDANDFKINKIVSLIKKSQSKKFLNSIKKIKNPYGNGKSSSKILDILYKTKIDDKLLIKNLTY